MSDTDARSSLRSAVGAFEVQVPPPKLSFGYRASLSGAAAVVVLLPLLYLAAVVAIGVGTSWWGANGWDLAPFRSVAKLRLVAYVAPLVTGAALTVVLLKPFLAKSAEGPEPFELNPEDEPLLYDFVNRLADGLGAPRPSRILVDNQVNASAGFRDGLRGWLKGDLELTLGMPLVANLAAAPASAIVGHELGHFAQGAGMRSYYLILRTQSWFARVVFGRDRFDEGLDGFAKRFDHFASWTVLNAARGGIWLSRKLLLGLMHVAEWIVKSLSRQMEFDADAQAVRAFGAKAFTESMLELPLIDLSSSKVEQLAQVAFRDGRLPDDWSSAVRHLRRGMGDGERRAAIRAAMESQPHMYASHPPTGARIERAKAAGHEPHHGFTGEATLLFEDFAELAREVTGDMYRRGAAAGRSDLEFVPAREFCGEFGGEQELRDVGARELGEDWAAPLLLRPDDGGESVEGGAERLRAVEEQQFERDGVERLQRVGLILRSLGAEVADEDFQLKGLSAAPGIETRLEQTEAMIAAMQPFSGPTLGRIAAAQRALGAGALELDAEQRQRLGDGLEKGLATLRACAPAAATWFELWRSGEVLGRVSEAFEDAGRPPVEERLRREISQLSDRLREQLGGAPYAFGDGPKSFADQVLLDPPGADWPLAEVAAWAQAAAHEGWDVYRRGLELAVGCAARVEAAAERAAVA